MPLNATYRQLFLVPQHVVVNPDDVTHTLGMLLQLIFLSFPVLYLSRLCDSQKETNFFCLCIYQDILYFGTARYFYVHEKLRIPQLCSMTIH